MQLAGLRYFSAKLDDLHSSVAHSIGSTVDVRGFRKGRNRNVSTSCGMREGRNRNAMQVSFWVHVYFPADFPQVYRLVPSKYLYLSCTIFLVT